MSTNVYKRFDPRVMESKERIGINRGLPTMVLIIFVVSEKKAFEHVNLCIAVVAILDFRST